MNRNRSVRSHDEGFPLTNIVELFDRKSFYTNRQASIALIIVREDREAVKRVLLNVDARIQADTRGEEADVQAEWRLFGVEDDAHHNEIQKILDIAMRNKVYDLTRDDVNKIFAKAHNVVL